MQGNVWTVDDSIRTGPFPFMVDANIRISITDDDGVDHCLANWGRSEVSFSDVSCRSARLRFELGFFQFSCPIEADHGVIGCVKADCIQFSVDERPFLAVGDALTVSQTLAPHRAYFNSGPLTDSDEQELTSVKPQCDAVRQAPRIDTWLGRLQSRVYGLLGGIITDPTHSEAKREAPPNPRARTTFPNPITAVVWHNVGNLAALAGHTEITSLDLHTEEELTEISVLKDLTKLRSLKIDSFDRLADLAVLSRMVGLEELSITFCPKLKEIAPLRNLSGLKSLSLSGCSGVEDLSALTELTQLTTLELIGCERVEDFGPLSGMTRLRTLNLSGCERLLDTSWAVALTQITSLNLSRCKRLFDIARLASFHHLTVLNLSGCDNVEDLAPLEKLTKLRQLDLGWCKSISNISSLATLDQLKSLDLSRCEKIADLRALAGLTKITSLNLKGCNRIHDLAPLRQLTQLKSLDLSECGSIEDLECLSELHTLRELKWVSEPAEAALLASCATNAGDVANIRSRHIVWSDTVAFAGKPDLLISRLARAFALGASDEWAAEGFERLIFAAQARADVRGATWQEMLTLITQHHATTVAERLLTLATTEVNGARVPIQCIDAALGAMSTLPVFCAGWARRLANEILGNMSNARDQRSIAPSAALFYRSLGDDAAVTHWLDIATDHDTSLWRDRVIAALARWDMQHGNVAAAQLRLREMQSAGARDEVLSSIAQAAAIAAPREAAATLIAMWSIDARAEVARELLSVPEFTASLDALPALLVSLQQNPDHLADLLTRLLAQHPDGAAARAIAGEFSCTHDEGVRQTLLGLLNHEVLQRKCDPDDLNPFAVELAANPAVAHEILIRGVLATLHSRGIVPNDKKASDILALLLPPVDA